VTHDSLNGEISYFCRVEVTIETGKTGIVVTKVSLKVVCFLKQNSCLLYFVICFFSKPLAFLNWYTHFNKTLRHQCTHSDEVNIGFSGI